jgi:hypothetical protein
MFGAWMKSLLRQTSAMKKFAAFMLMASGTTCLVSVWYSRLPESLLWMRVALVLVGLLSVVTAFFQLRGSN